MKARSTGAVVAIAVGLVVAVAVPAGAQPRSAPAQQIVTAVSRTASLTMKSGFSHYLFVGGSSLGADITKTSFAHANMRSCNGPPFHRTELPFGPSRADSPEGSFATSGSLAAIAGIGISGYTVKGSESNYGASLGCGTGVTNAPFSAEDNITTSDAVENKGEVLVILVGTSGVGTLAPSLITRSLNGCSFQGDNQLTTLRNVTVSKNRSEGTAVAIFSAQLNSPLTDCDFSVYGTTLNTANELGNVAIWVNVYILTPDR